MADAQIGTNVDYCFVNRQKVQGTNSSTLANSSNYVSITALRTRLNAINPAYWTSTLMNRMTVNDLVYAVRLLDDANTI